MHYQCQVPTVQNPRIEIVTQSNECTPGGYPVLKIHTVIFWPSVADLHRLRAEIDRWLISPDGMRIGFAEYQKSVMADHKTDAA